MQSRPGSRIILLRTDGEMIARTPVPGGVLLHNASQDGPLLQHLALEPMGSVYTATSAIDGVDCLFASARVGRYPLVVVYRLELATALVTWHQRLAILAAICALAATALAGSVLLAIRQARRLEQEQIRRAAAEQTALTAQRLEILAQLAAGVAHDFGNVVQAVEIGAMIIRSTVTDERTLKMAKMIGEAAGQGRWLTRRMLDLATHDIGHDRDGTDKGGQGNDGFDPVLRPTEVITEVSRLMSATLGAGYRIRYEVESDGLPTLVRGAHSGLEGAVMNLAINARDAMPNGGEVLIRLEPEWVLRPSSCANRPAYAAAMAPGLYARISVADTGDGMLPEVLARASEPFFTTKPRGRGTGLGLAGARGFARGAGGGFHIESAQGVGTKVSLWLPEIGDKLSLRQASCQAEVGIGSMGVTV